jgi:hypothetical protein
VIEAPEPEDKLDATTATVGVVNGPEDAPFDWHAIDWRRVEGDVRRLRQRIFAASKAGDLGRVRNLVAVGTALHLRLGPPPAQIPACAANAPGSSLEYERRIARWARDAGSGLAAASAPRDGPSVPMSGWCAGCDAEAPGTSAASPGHETS